MSLRLFYPPVDLPDQVQSYAQGVADHKADYGAIPQNSPADLKAVVAHAKTLEPLAEECHDLELTLAAKLEAYHKAAAPLWKEFSEKLGYAKVYAQKNEKTALLNFLRGFQHHVVRHAAAAAAGAVPTTTTK